MATRFSIPGSEPDAVRAARAPAAAASRADLRRPSAGATPSDGPSPPVPDRSRERESGPLELSDMSEPPPWLGGDPLDDVDTFANVRDGQWVEPRRANRVVARMADLVPAERPPEHGSCAPEIPVGSVFTEAQWRSVRAGGAWRATAIELVTPGGTALLSASWDEPGHRFLASLGVSRLRLVQVGASPCLLGQVTARAALGVLSIDDVPEGASRRWQSNRDAKAMTVVGSAIVDKETGEVLGTVGRAESSQGGARSFYILTTPADWGGLREMYYPGREQAWYDERQQWPTDAPIGIVHRPGVDVGAVSVPDWCAAADANMAIVGPSCPGQPWTETEAQAVTEWYEQSLADPANWALAEQDRIRLEDDAIVRLADIRGSEAPSATQLIATALQRYQSVPCPHPVSPAPTRGPKFDIPRG